MRRIRGLTAVSKLRTQLSSSNKKHPWSQTSVFPIHHHCRTAATVASLHADEIERIDILEKSKALCQILTASPTKDLVEVPISNVQDLVLDGWLILDWWAHQRTMESVQWSVELLKILCRQAKPDLGYNEYDDEDYGGFSPESLLLQSLIVNWSLVWQEIAKDTPEYVEDSNNPLLRPIELWDAVQSCNQHLPSVEWTPEAINFLIQTANFEFFVQEENAMTYSERAEFCTKILQYCWEKDPPIAVRKRTVNFVLRAWKQSGAATGEDTSVQAMELLSQASGRRLVDVVSFNTVLGTFAQHNHAVQAEKLLLDWAEQCETSPATLPLPDRVSIHCCLKAWSQSNTVGAADRCLSLFGKLHDSSHFLGRLGVQPNTTTFNILMHCWSRQLVHMSREQVTESAQLTRVLLDEMQENGASLRPTGHEKVPESDVEPDIISYSTALNVFAKAGEVAMAQELLDKLTQRSMDGDRNCRPTARMYGSILEAWGRSNHPKRVENAEASWQKWHELAACGVIAPPNTVAYNILLQVYVRANELDKAMDLFDSMTEAGAEPDHWTFGSLIFPLIKRDPLKAGANVSKLLHLAIEKGVVLDINVWNAVIAALSRSGEYEVARKILNQALDNADGSLFSGEIDDGTYGPFLHRLHNNTEDCAPDVHEIVRKVEDLYSSGHIRAPPSSGAYESAIVAWTKYHLKGPKFSLSQSHKILNFMRRQVAGGELIYEPSVGSYHAVVRAMCKVRYVETAEELLQQMYHSHQRRPETAAKPTPGIFASILFGWSRSRESQAAGRSESLMKNMIRLGLEPTSQCYESLLTSLKKSKSHDKASRMTQWLEHMKQNGEPTQKVYRLMGDTWISEGNTAKAIELMEEEVRLFGNQGQGEYKGRLGKVSLMGLSDEQQQAVAQILSTAPVMKQDV